MKKSLLTRWRWSLQRLRDVPCGYHIIISSSSFQIKMPVRVGKQKDEEDAAQKVEGFG
jgi:hypothetical protein